MSRVIIYHDISMLWFTRVVDKKVYGNESKDKQQLELPFSYDSELDNQEEIYSELETNRIENREENSFTVVQQRALRYYSQAQRRYLDQLERGYYNAYAGGLLFASLLGDYYFMSILKRVIDITTYEGYSLEELSITLFYLDIFGFRSMWGTFGTL